MNLENQLWNRPEPVLLRVVAVLLACALPLQPNGLTAEQVPVRHKEGLMHGFLALRTLEGKKLADGEMTQVTEGDRLTDDLIFRFKDGSIYEDKTVFTQKGSFRLLSDHLVKKGPSFKQPMETLIDASTGQVTVHYKDHDGKEKVLKQKLKLPPDLVNGLMFTLVKRSKSTRSSVMQGHSRAHCTFAYSAFACLRTGMSGRRPVAIAPIPLRASSLSAADRRARVIISATYLGFIVVLTCFPRAL